MLRFVEGWDGYTSVYDSNCQWVDASTIFGHSGLVAGRYGGKCLFMGKGAWYAYIPPASTVIAGANFADIVTPLAFREGGISHVSISWDGRFNIYVGSTPVALSRSFSGGWHHVQMKAVIHPTNGSIVLRVDGNDEVNITNITTQNGGTGLVDNVYTADGDFSYVDDFFIMDGTGPYNNDIIRTGEPRVESLWPTSNGDIIQFNPLSSTNVAMIDEVGVDGDTTYNSALPTGTTDTFYFNSVSQLTGSILGVQPRVSARKENASNRAISPAIIPSTGGLYTTISGILTESYRFIQKPVEVDPGTGIPWTVSGLNMVQLGYKIII
jgi:hypothetical protein